MALYIPDRDRWESEKTKIFKLCHLAFLLHILGIAERTGGIKMELSKKDREAIAQLAKSSDAQKLMELLQKQSGQVRQAAQAAAGGDPAQLMAMMDQLMHSREGAELVDRIGSQARQAGLE